MNRTQANKEFLLTEEQLQNEYMITVSKEIGRLSKKKKRESLDINIQRQ